METRQNLRFGWGLGAFETQLREEGLLGRA